MGRPRYTSPAEQIVWLEHHVEELEAENQRLLVENKELCEDLGIEWTELPGNVDKNS